MTAHIIVVGAGVAGLSAALAAGDAGAHVSLIVPGDDLSASGGNTSLAQGGIAAAMGLGDHPSAHAADTVRSGAGLVRADAAELLATAGVTEMRRLIAAGFAIDRDGRGAPSLGLEGAHGAPRIVHAGEDCTGASLHTFLQRAVEMRGDRIDVHTGLTVTDLMVTELPTIDLTVIDLHREAGSVCGAVVRRRDGTSDRMTADSVVLATGGYAGIFSRTSSAHGTTGDGILLAARAGALLADLEFVQFHPTVVADQLPGARSLLISEAVRGAGAVLRDAEGRRFMQAADPRAELASRDVVSREIARVMRGQAEPVWLDATSIERARAGSLARRFPMITQALADRGIDWARDPVPIAPAAHYTMGGIATDLDGRTTVPGLFAAGEVAATGVHGANRLASNSLLEGLVFGMRAGRAAAIRVRGSEDDTVGEGRGEWSVQGRALAELAADALVVELPGTVRAGTESIGAASSSAAPSRTVSASRVTHATDAGLGIIRSAESLRETSQTLTAFSDDRVFGSIAQLGLLMTAAAQARTESRGAHYRNDFPGPDESQGFRRAVRTVFAETSRDPVFPSSEKETHPC